jgi:hypothetical protein
MYRKSERPQAGSGAITIDGYRYDPCAVSSRLVIALKT